MDKITITILKFDGSISYPTIAELKKKKFKVLFEEVFIIKVTNNEYQQIKVTYLWKITPSI